MEPRTPPAGARAADEQVLDGLNDLLQLDHDAVGAYEVAIEKLEDREHADQIAGFMRDHERHIRELNDLLVRLGGAPRNEPHATGPLKQALQSLGGLAGDKGILMAWRTNELAVRKKYDSYASAANAWPAEAKRVVDRNALDEERHYRWVSEVLSGMGIGGEDGGALGAAREAAGEARERVSAGVDAVRNRVAGLLESSEGEGGAAAAVRERASDAADAARARYGDVEDRIRERPLQTLLAAAAAGFVIGRLLR